MTRSEQLTLRLVVHGRVQGVFFRDSMRQEAEKLGINGWVRNLSDGTVEALVQGAASAVEEIVRWTHSGPPQAKVIKVDTEQRNGGNYSSFEIRYR